MAPRAYLWRILTQFRHGQSVLQVQRCPRSPSLRQIRCSLLSTHLNGSFSTSDSIPCTTPIRHSSSSVGSASSDKLTFEEYRKLRKSLKMRGRVAGIPMGFLGMGISSFINVQFNPNMFNMTPEEVQPVLGMDPIVFSALCGVASGITGYILGGALFHGTWRLLYKKKAQALKDRENDFLERVQRYRFSDVSRYDDDYYGDKVMTLSDYRQWVRQQQKRQEQLGKSKETAQTDADTEPNKQS